MALSGVQSVAEPGQIVVHLLAVGSAQRLKTTKFKVDADKQFVFVINFLRKQLQTDVFVYCNQAFAPAPDVPLIDLFRCFQVNNALVIYYCNTHAEFCEFFQQRGHTPLPSSSLVPNTDPSLLFTNAGMVQFKDWFGDTTLASTHRAVTVQRCMRAGGKHNDLDNVGKTARHHTLFEMLGNFAFSDATDAAEAQRAASCGEPSPLKAESIVNAWDFLTQVVMLPPERLRVTVHEEDKDSAQIWRNVIGLSDSQVVLGREDNWWSMGNGAGPVGPCSEIFWDQQREVDGEQWLELWNLVFMEQMRCADGTLSSLPRPCVDTGMGLERLASVLQGVRPSAQTQSDSRAAVPSNYHIDAFQPLFVALAELAGLEDSSHDWAGGHTQEAIAARAIVDHLRAISFLLCDGVVPSNVGRGYTFRRVLRRAVRHGALLGFDRPFLSQLLPVLATSAEYWTHVVQRLEQVASVVKQEEELFLKTMSRGLELLSVELALIEQDATSDVGERILGAESTFQLYDTFGFPFDLTSIIAMERGFTVDLRGAEQLMAAQRARARASWAGTKKAGNGSARDLVVPRDVQASWHHSKIQTEFIGYDTLTDGSTEVVAVAMDRGEEAGWIVLRRCPFFPTGGGQLGDVGVLTLCTSSGVGSTCLNDGANQCFVTGTVQPFEGMIACRIVPGAAMTGGVCWLPSVGDAVEAHVSVPHRRGCSAHHTATHILAAALRAVLPSGTSLVQAGSSVEPEKLRFDCSGIGNTALSKERLDKANALANAAIKQGMTVRTRVQPLDAAIASGAIADFGEKYGETVRIVTIGDGVSMRQVAEDVQIKAGIATFNEASHFVNLLHAGELCGGTHVKNTADMFAFHIVRESGIGAGTRRVEALASEAAYNWHLQRSQMLDSLADELRVPVAGLPARVRKLSTDHKARKIRRPRSGSDRSDSTTPMVTVPIGNDVVCSHAHNLAEIQGVAQLRAVASAAAKESPAVTYLIMSGGHLVACAGKSSAIGADVVLRKCVGLVGGRGGGSAQFAQGILDAGKNGATRSDGWEGECFAALCEAARQAFGSETR